MARTRPLRIMLTDAELAEVKARAGAHRRAAATWARAALLGEQSATVKDADDWWNGLPPARRAQVHAWVAGGRGTPDPIPGQLALVEE